MYKLVAHRGYPEKFPENSLSGIKAALTAGAKAIEFDIQCSSDGTPFVFHDECTLRVTGQAHIIHQINDATVSTLSAHYPDKFSRNYLPTPISTLKEVCNLLKFYPNVEVFIEPKAHSINALGVEKVMTAILADSSQLSTQQRRIISFHHQALYYARQQGCPVINLVIDDFSQASKRLAQSLRPNMLCIDAKEVNGPLPNWIDAQWMIYPIDDKESLTIFADYGASYIETDAIGRML